MDEKKMTCEEEGTFRRYTVRSPKGAEGAVISLCLRRGRAGVRAVPAMPADQSDATA